MRVHSGDADSDAVGWHATERGTLPGTRRVHSVVMSRSCSAASRTSSCNRPSRENRASRWSRAKLLTTDVASRSPPRVPVVGRPLPHNLPAQEARLVGREHDLTDVHRLMAEHRLLTLTGAGGIGKTRLALEAAARVVDLYQD